MTQLHMISLPVDLRELARLAAQRGLSTRSPTAVGAVAVDEGRVLHHLLSEAFGKGVFQPFRLMPGRGARVASLYGYADANEAALRDAIATTSLPEHAKVFDFAHLAAKALPDTWASGRRLAFDVRVRPVRRLSKPLDAWSRERARGKRSDSQDAMPAGSEVDAFLVERMRSSPEGPVAGEGRSRDDVYLDWLAERLGPAAMLDRAATRLVSYERAISLRGGKPLEAPDATFHGELTIADPAKFQERLALGVGRHRAYGYGMLLLRPARR